MRALDSCTLLCPILSLALTQLIMSLLGMLPSNQNLSGTCATSKLDKGEWDTLANGKSSGTPTISSPDSRPPQQPILREKQLSFKSPLTYATHGCVDPPGRGTAQRCQTGISHENPAQDLNEDSEVQFCTWMYRVPRIWIQPNGCPW